MKATPELPPALTPEDPDYTRERYSVRAAAAYLFVSIWLIYDEAASGRLAHRRDRGGRTSRLTFSQADLDDWRNHQRTECRTASRPVTFPAAPPVLPLPARRRFR